MTSNLAAASPSISVKPAVATSYRWAAGLTIVLLIVFAIAAIDPVDRTIWATENLLPLFLVVYLAFTARSFPFSRLSYTLMFIFLCLHQLGAHYTYVNVPYDAALESLTGVSVDRLFGAERNHYDRFAHLAYGLLFAYPLREVVLRLAGVRGFWGYFLPVSLVMSTSLLYEFIEWGIAYKMAPEQGAIFLGTQGDPWDAHWDLLAASVGSLVVMLTAAVFNTAASGKSH